MKPMITALTCTALLAACADQGANYTPILDGAPNAAFAADLAECQSLARAQFDGDALGAAALGAGAGAVLGEFDDEGTALGGALVGALAGGVAGSVDTADSRKAIVISCMKGRGHAVVG